MKLHSMEIPLGKVVITLILLTCIPLLLKKSPVMKEPKGSLSSATTTKNGNSTKCDIFTGEWVPNEEAPYYTNRSCWKIHEQVNCMKYGRPDMDFLKWRWKPDGCELSTFNPSQFLEIVRDKKLAFISDSVGRNQMQSLICLLSAVEYPIDVSYRPEDYFKRQGYLYKTYNFTLASFWAPFLVKAEEDDPNGPSGTGIFGLHLDEPDESWTTKIDKFDYIIFSDSNWFHRPLMYYENGHLIGCQFCGIQNMTDYPISYGYQRAFRTAFKAILGRKNFKGVTYLRTISPSHYEDGVWNKGGNCLRKKPFRNSEMTLDGDDLDLYKAQMKEVKAAQREGRDRGLKFRVIDTTQAMLLRPDGHPSRYGHWPEENVTRPNDCVHWCLPGPIDSWNEFLLEMLKKERVLAHVFE
ncbi:trichome birefringence-like 19-like protein [Drosera capensis]